MAKSENIVAKGEIARFVQFLLLSLCFQKAVCCRGVRKRLYEGKVKSVARWLGKMLCVVLVQDGQDTHSKVDCLLGCVK